MFSIGGLMKQEVREIASRAGLPSARRKDSQGICFLGKINYNDFVRRFRNKVEIIDTELTAKLRFDSISMRDIDDIFLNILLDHKPGTATQSESFPLSDRMEPVAAMRAHFLSGFQFYNRPFPLSQETTNEIIIVNLSQKANSLTVLSSGPERR